MKIVKSFLVDKNKIFVPLPKEQQLTEESLIALERQIIKASQKNDMVLDNSMIIAEHSIRCSDSSMVYDDNKNDEIININSQEQSKEKTLRKIR